MGEKCTLLVLCIVLCVRCGKTIQSKGSGEDRGAIITAQHKTTGTEETDVGKRSGTASAFLFLNHSVLSHTLAKDLIFDDQNENENY